MARGKVQQDTNAAGYRCVCDIYADGVHYAPGATVQLTDEQANSLLQIGAIAHVDQSADESKQVVE